MLTVISLDNISNLPIIVILVVEISWSPRKSPHPQADFSISKQFNLKFLHTPKRREYFMSARPNWFRFVLGIFVFTLISTSFLVRVDAQHAVSREEASGNPSPQGEKQELMEELFPYSSKTRSPDSESADLITATTYAFSFL